MGDVTRERKCIAHTHTVRLIAAPNTKNDMAIMCSSLPFDTPPSLKAEQHLILGWDLAVAWVSLKQVTGMAILVTNNRLSR
jgi:hypothetical protein